jgi:hypothetical protein
MEIQEMIFPRGHGLLSSSRYRPILKKSFYECFKNEKRFDPSFWIDLINEYRHKLEVGEYPKDILPETGIPVEVGDIDRVPAESSLQLSGGMEDAMNFYEESFKRFAEGEVVTGHIISIDKDHVLVDIGYRSEGQIGIHEFRDEAGNIAAEVGEAVEVMVEWWDEK